MNYINKFQKFMYGRYGIDELYTFLFKVYLFLFIINIFIRSSILTYLELFIRLALIYFVMDYF